MENAILRGKCPVCFGVPRANIFQCANEHSMCESCSTRLTVCPTCQSPGLTVRNRFAEGLLDGMMFNCSWSGRGCDGTMRRGQLSAHEDMCDQNPNIITFCSKFPEARNCPYKFTPKWLSAPENCINFKTHVTTCLNILCFQRQQFEKPFLVSLLFGDIFSKKYNPTRLAHHSYSPFFFRFPSPTQEGKVELLALFFLLKVDALENQTLSFALVQLTPDTTQMDVELRIYGEPSPNMSSHHGQDSLPPLCWSQKPMRFNEFLEMVKKVPNGQESEISFPFSLPVSFLSKYYARGDKPELYVEFNVGLTS